MALAIVGYPAGVASTGEIAYAEAYMNKLRIALACGAIGMMSAPAAAVVTVYTSQATFDAAVSGETTFGFDEGNSADHFHVTPNPYTQSGITFVNNITAADIATGGTPVIFLIGNATTPAYGVDFLSFQNTQVGISANLTSPGVTALGFNYASYIVGGAATIAVNGGLPTAITVGNTPSFIGFTSSTPITDLNISFPTAYSFDLTDISYGTANDAPPSVPEPASWAMLITGFGMIGAAARRRQRATVRSA